MENAFGEYWLLTLIISAILTWGIGLAPPLIIRFVIAGRPLSKGISIGLVILFLIINLMIFSALGSESKTHMALFFVAWASYYILRKKTKRKSRLKGDNDTACGTDMTEYSQESETGKPPAEETVAQTKTVPENVEDEKQNVVVEKNSTMGLAQENDNMNAGKGQEQFLVTDPKELIVAFGFIAVVFIAVIYVAYFSNIPTSIWVCSNGSPEKPVRLPSRELVKLMDKTGGPVKTTESPALFLVSLNNQTEWFLTSIEVRFYKYKETSEEVKSKYNFRPIDLSEENSRIYLGTPLSFLIEKGEYDKVSAISPKSSGKFYFNIGHFLSWEKQREGYKTEYVFEPYYWILVAANGYKR